jgi:hypothetical protein
VVLIVHDPRGHRRAYRGAVTLLVSTRGHHTEEDPMTTDTLVDRYLAAWNATDPAARREAIVATFTPDARYVDPMADVRGHDGLDALIAGAQAQFAGLAFTRGELLDAHHDVVRFTWHLGPESPAGAVEPVVIGFDVAVVADDGRVAEVHGFLDRVPG